MCGSVLLGVAIYQMYRPPVSQVSSSLEIQVLMVLGAGVLILSLLSLLRLSQTTLAALCCQCSDVLSSNIALILVTPMSVSVCASACLCVCVCGVCVCVNARAGV